jgi:Mycothiol maleylpyruvate isomerase N-terminal domain
VPDDAKDVDAIAPAWTDDLAAALAECLQVVRAGSHADWSRPAGRLDWDCRSTVLHLASDFVAYAGQLTAPRRAGYVPFEVVLEGEPDADGLAEVVRATGGLLGSVVRTAAPDVLSWHPYGMAGPRDFCAMGVLEALVHTHDLSAGLGVAWTAPAHLAARVLAHLFGRPSPTGDPWSALLLATGRLADEDGAFRTGWRWRNSGS